LQIGVALIDAAVGGVDAGLPLVIEAGQEAGHIALFLQLLGGALARGERAVFLSPEPPTLVLRQAAAMEIDLESPLGDGRFVLLEMMDSAAAQIRSAGPRTFARALREAAPDATFLAIHPMSALTEEILEEAELRAVVRTLYEDWSHAHLALGVETEQLDSSSGLRRTLLQSCGAYVRVERVAGPHCLMHVERVRTREVPEAPLPFRLTHRGALLDPDALTGAASPPAAREPAEAPPPASNDRADPAESEDRPTVLVIDDDAVARELYSDWLRDRYELLTARDGSDGIATFMAHHPDLILLDLEMPKVSGFEVMRALCGASEWVPIIVISGRIRRAVDRVRPFLLGAADVIAKPPERFDLVRRVDALIRSESPPPDYTDFALLRDAKSATRVLSEEELRRRMERASRIARRFDIASCLLSLEVSQPETLETVVSVADEELRVEDAVCAVGASRALFLLVGAPREGAATALGRLCKAFERRGIDVPDLRGQLLELEPGLEGKDWPEFFKEMTPWLTLRAR